MTPVFCDQKVLLTWFLILPFLPPFESKARCIGFIHPDNDLWRFYHLPRWRRLPCPKTQSWLQTRWIESECQNYQNAYQQPHSLIHFFRRNSSWSRGKTNMMSDGLKKPWETRYSLKSFSRFLCLRSIRRIFSLPSQSGRSCLDLMMMLFLVIFVILPTKFTILQNMVCQNFPMTSPTIRIYILQRGDDFVNAPAIQNQEAILDVLHLQPTNIHLPFFHKLWIKLQAFVERVDFRRKSASFSRIWIPISGRSPDVNPRSVKTMTRYSNHRNATSLLLLEIHNLSRQSSRHSSCIPNKDTLSNTQLSSPEVRLMCGHEASPSSDNCLCH